MPRDAVALGAIVMVDDSESDIFLAQECYELSRTENELVCLASGEELLDYLGEVGSGAKSMPAVVLLDIKMPLVSGFDVLRRLQEKPSLYAIPPIKMLTSSDDPLDAATSKELGADGFVTKPADVNGYVALFDSIGDEFRFDSD